MTRLTRATSSIPKKYLYPKRNTTLPNVRTRRLYAQRNNRSMAAYMTRSDSPMAVRHIDLSFESGDCEGSALRLIYALLPEWESSEGDVELIKFTEGITNTVC